MRDRLFRFGSGATELADLVSETPSAGPLKRWVYGILLPPLPVGFGVMCFLHGLAKAGGWGHLAGNLRDGWIATALVSIGLGAYLHFHFFWAPSPRFWLVGAVGRNLAALTAVAGLVLWLVGTLVLS